MLALNYCWFILRGFKQHLSERLMYHHSFSCKLVLLYEEEYLMINNKIHLVTLDTSLLKKLNSSLQEN